MSFLKLKHGQNRSQKDSKKIQLATKTQKGPLKRQAFANNSVYPSADIEQTFACLVSARRWREQNPNSVQRWTMHMHSVV